MEKQLAEALFMVLGNTLLEARDNEGEITHDWTTCKELSCRNARKALRNYGWKEVPE